MVQLTLDHINTFWGNIFSRFSSNDEASDYEILKLIPIFKDLSKRELKYLSSIVYQRSYEEGEYIFDTGQPGAAMFIIKDGKVNITKLNENGDEIILATLEEGEFLGELALLDNSGRSASAYALSRIQTLSIFRADLEKLLETRPALGGKIMRRLAVVIGLRLKATNELLIQLEEKYATKASE